MSDTLEQAKEQLSRAIHAHFRDLVHNKTLTHYAAKLAEQDLWHALKQSTPQMGALIAAVRAEAQREAFEAGYMEGFGTNNAETLDAKRDAAFAAYLTRQAGLQVDLKRE